jgi:hypothetical protein
MNGVLLLNESVTASASLAPPLEGRRGTRTSVIGLGAPVADVFNTLADIEALPRWAGRFCERIYLDRGRWRGLTSLGELWLELEVNADEGSMALLAGREEGDSRRVEWQVMPGLAGGSRVLLCVVAAKDDLQRRLSRALEDELWGLTARWGGGVGSGGVERAS